MRTQDDASRLLYNVAIHGAIQTLANVRYTTGVVCETAEAMSNTRVTGKKWIFSRHV